MGPHDRGGKRTDDRQLRKFRQFFSQTLRSDLPSGESRLYRLRARGSTPLCSTRKPCRSRSARFFRAHFSVVQSMQILHSCPWYITQGLSFAACDPSHLFPPGHTRLANTPRILTINNTVQPCNRPWRSLCNSKSDLKTGFSACHHRHSSRR
jgi:hypothetical protein